MAEINTDNNANKAVTTPAGSTSPITYRLDQFEGPLDLLLTLIQKNKFDIADIPISALCDQYMEYIESARSLDLNITSDFLVMASQLMLIKSRMLLPRERDGAEDPRSELAASVLEYARTKYAATAFATMYAAYNGRFAKETDEIPPDNTVFPHDVSLLTSALARIFAETKTVENAKTTHFTPLIRKKAASVTEKAMFVMRYLRRAGPTPLSILFKSCSTRHELIPTFLAVLELLKSGRVVITEGYEDDAGSLSVDELTIKLVLRNKVPASDVNNT